LPLKPSYLLLTGAGAIVAVAGVKGWGISSTLRDVVSGQNPSANPVLANTIAATNYGYGTGASGGSSPTGGGAGGLAGIAQSLIGFPYVWGGAPAKGASDCSGFVNWCCYKAGLGIPGYPWGSWTGQSHGPNTLVWLASPLTSRVAGGLAAAQPGDLAVWQTHMGIITQGGGNGMMVSDLNPSLGTKETPINGPNGGAPPFEVLVVERFKTQAPVAVAV
jgi:cell wall-associated NlpC family hydrolase